MILHRFSCYTYLMGRLKKHIPAYWFSNYKVKLFSILGALLIWFYVVTDNYFEVTVRVPLQLVNFPQGYILANEIPSHIKVLFRGSGKSLFNFYYHEKSIELDLHQIRQSAIFRLNIGMINGISPGVNIAPLRIVYPDSVLVKLDKYAIKQVAVHSNLKMKPMDGYTMIGDIQLKPDSVFISGPEMLVSKIEFVETVTKTYDRLLKPLKGNVTLIRSENKILQYTMDDVQFTADIQRIGERFISGIPIQVLNAPSNVDMSVIPSTLSLKLQGGVSLLAGLGKQDIVASIDYRSRSRYRGEGIPANIKLPPDITFSDVHPKFFELRVNR